MNGLTLLTIRMGSLFVVLSLIVIMVFSLVITYEFDFKFLRFRVAFFFQGHLISYFVIIKISASSSLSLSQEEVGDIMVLFLFISFHQGFFLVLVLSFQVHQMHHLILRNGRPFIQRNHLHFILSIMSLMLPS